MEIDAYQAPDCNSAVWMGSLGCVRTCFSVFYLLEWEFDGVVVMSNQLNLGVNALCVVSC